MEQQETPEASKASRLKASEKAAPECQREYLDMDTDEEEFGRQETPEPLDEAPPEPDKPELSSEELDILLEQTKSLSVLAELREESWTAECAERIREYFEEPGNTTLTIYFAAGRLRARLGLPGRTDSGLAYFLREPWQIYRPDNFLSSVAFGSVSGPAERTLLSLVAGVYAPLVFADDCWPEIMRDEIFSNVNDFLTRATELAYSPMGSLVLYTPWEGGRGGEEERRLAGTAGESRAARTRRRRDRELLINRLEKVARTWIGQIREALLIKIGSPEGLYDLDGELQFFGSRHANMTSVSRQLESERVRLLAEQLKRVRSPSVRDLKRLTLKVKEALSQAEANLIYLDLVLHNCASLTEPEQVQDCLPKLLHTIRFVWTDSTYYNEPANIERLLCSLSVQIVKMCINNIDLQLLFDDPKKCRQAVKTCLRCCECYAKIYDSIISSCMESENNWKTKKDVVFNSVNAFEQRCQDVIEICDAIIIYGSLNKINLGGTRGNQHETQYRRVKDYFAEITSEMRVVCNCALDVRQIKWFDDMSKFRRDVAQLENTIRNLLNSLFEDVKDIEMGIETLYTLLKFKDRRGFQDILHDKWTQVWKLFYEEIKICSSSTADYEVVQDKIKLLESHSAAETMIHKNYLARLHKMMIDASDWLGDCDIQYEVLKYLKTK